MNEYYSNRNKINNTSSQPNPHKSGLDISHKTELRTQLSYELLQSVGLLELTNLELAEWIQQELERNPALETEDESEDESNIDERDIDIENEIPVPDEIFDDYDEYSADSEKKEDENYEDGKKDGIADNESENDNIKTSESESETEFTNEEIQEIFGDASDTGYIYENSGEEKDSFETYTKAPVSLFSKLQEQLLLTFHNNDDYKIAIFLISSITEQGMLNISVESAAEYCKTNVETIDRIRHQVIQLDPPGICSLNVHEFLLFQIKNTVKVKYWTRLIIENYFDLFQKHKFDEIIRHLKINKDVMQESKEEIARLAPYPSLAFEDDFSDNHYIIPEVVFKKISGEWIVIIDNEYIPSIKISPHYRNLILSGQINKAEKNFIKDHIISGENLIKAIRQRQTTMRRVAERILVRQLSFFEEGIMGLKPMILRDIAEELKLHESTISRCTRGKYCQTPHGIFELKFFFTSSLATTAGDKISNAVIKERIKKMIHDESEDDLLSDIAIWKELIREGLMVDRKTISNYRDDLGILPRHLRKKIFDKK